MVERNIDRPMILISDDEPAVVELVKLIFSFHRPAYDLRLAYSGQETLRMFREEQPDLILLDVALPDLDGFEVCRRIRASSPVAIIMLTAKGREEERVRGLELGADDYVIKPFGHQELVARVDAVLRRTRRGTLIQAQQPVLEIGQLRIDPNQERVWKGGGEVDLTPTEFRLLYTLASHSGHVLQHSLLLSNVWGEEYESEHHYLKVYVNRLRHKLEDDPSKPAMILTAWGVGYRFASQEEL